MSNTTISAPRASAHTEPRACEPSAATTSAKSRRPAVAKREPERGSPRAVAVGESAADLDPRRARSLAHERDHPLALQVVARGPVRELAAELGLGAGVDDQIGGHVTGAALVVVVCTIRVCHGKRATRGSRQRRGWSTRSTGVRSVGARGCATARGSCVDGGEGERARGERDRERESAHRGAMSHRDGSSITTL